MPVASVQRAPTPVARTLSPPVKVSRSPAGGLPVFPGVITPVLSLLPRSRLVQPSLAISSPTDAAEKEATSTARRITHMKAPDGPVSPVMTLGRRAARRISCFPEARLIHRQAEGTARTTGNVAADIQSHMAVGAPLPPGVRGFMEPRFGADFSNVRIHTGASSAALNAQLTAQAFATGNHIFFGKGKFQPQSEEGRELIAHELTHTIQQGAVVQRSVEVNVTERTPRQVHRLFGSLNPLNWLADKANVIPGFRMFTIILGVNPINMSPVSRSAANILRALIEFIPGGGLITQALDNSGVFEKAGAFVEQQIAGLGLVGSSIKQAVTAFIDSLSLSDLAHLGDVWDRAKRIFTEPIDRIISFGKGLVNGIIQLIKDAILRPLAKLAEGTEGYNLLKGVLGKDPITGDPVPRTAETLLGPFMKMIGQGEIWENMQKANAISRCWAWFQSTMSQLIAIISDIPGAFVAAFKSLTIEDIILVPKAFIKLGKVFLGFLGRFISWGLNAAWNLLEIIFDVVSPGALMYIKKTGSALKSILKNPLPFVGNLVKAAKLGFTNFGSNFLTHLKNGLIEWLTGALEGVYIPKALSLAEMGKFALSVLGITWAQIRAKIVKALGPTGEKIMTALETAFDIVVALVNGGPAAAWEVIKDKLSDLKDTVVGGVVSMVIEAVVTKAVPKLISMFIPGAGFISAIISIYDTVMVFVNKISKIIQVVKGFIDSIVGIAAGAIAPAAAKVESTLAGLLSLAISFLAGFVGLGKVADKVLGVVKKVQAAVDKALDVAINWIVGKAKALFGKLFGKDKDGKPDERTSAQKEVAVQSAKLEADALLEATLDKPQALNAKFPDLKARHRLTKIELEQATANEFDILVEINPSARTKKKKFDPSKLSVGDVVLGLYKDPRWVDPERERWVPGIVTSLDSAKRTFAWKSANLKVPRTAVFKLADHDTKWKEGHTSQVLIPEDELLEHNMQESWPSMEIARPVLNYRRHQSQVNPPGTQWEHIIEKTRGGGANSSDNLALTASTINNRLGVLFGKPYASHEAPSGLPGTNDLPLRSYLADKSSDIKSRWKEFFYADLGVSLKWNKSARGKWQELN